MDRREFIKTYYPAADSVSRKTGIPAEFIISQLALETGWGKYGKHFNLSGIKARKNSAGQPIDPAFLSWTWEYVPNLARAYQFPDYDPTKTEKVGTRYKVRVKDYFRKYASAGEFLNDYTRLLLSSRYRPALAYKSEWRVYARKIIEAGYATLDADEYVNRLQKIYNLARPEIENLRKSGILLNWVPIALILAGLYVVSKKSKME